MDQIWPASDRWSRHTQRNITRLIDRFVAADHQIVLNAGCGDNEYALSSRLACVNVDISMRQCRSLRHAVVADVEALPFHDSCFQATVCVGAVLNYVEPYNAIPELIRVTRPRGLILVDFETTHTAELLFSSHWGRRVSVVERNYAGKLDKTFLFSAEYIRQILTQYGADVFATRRYHTSTAIWHRVFSNTRLPHAIVACDGWLSRVPGVSNLASNVIFACRKF